MGSGSLPRSTSFPGLELASSPSAGPGNQAGAWAEFWCRCTPGLRPLRVLGDTAGAAWGKLGAPQL